MSEKVYLAILKTGVYLSLVVVFFVFKSLLFPYITSKQISFNILIEVLLIFWIAFIVKYPQWRPKRSWITIGLAAYFLVTLISSFFGVDFNLSFWGDIERMLGVFHILHFFALYLIIITVMREWQDWKIFFIISVIIAFIVSIHSLSTRGYATIGNTAYVSGYIIFNLYFAVLLFATENYKGLRWLYLIPVPFFLAAFRLMSNSGAFVGLGLSIFIVLLLYILLSKNKKIKIGALISFVVIAAVVGIIFVNRDSEFVKSNYYLQMARSITFKKNTFQTRMISWRAAWQEFSSNPFLGTGHGNYAIIFDKHFDPTFYNYTRSETYFDRAHNNVVDIAATTGIFGILAYLSIFVATFYYLIKSYREEKLVVHEFILIIGLIIAYFVQNLAVFDSLVTYMGLMIVLGFVYWLYVDGDETLIDEIKEKARKAMSGSSEGKGLSNKEILSFMAAGAILLTILYQFNYKPLKMLVATIDAQMAHAQGGIAAATDAEKQAMSFNTILDRDSRTSYNRLLVSNPNALNNLDRDKAEEVLEYNIELAEANVKYNEHDSLNQMLLAQVLNVASSYYKDNPEKFSYYSNRALAAIDASIAASPGRVPIYFQKAQIYLTRGEVDKAIETLQYATSLNEDYPDSFCYLARVLFFSQKEEEGYQAMDQCIDKNGADWVLSDANLIKTMINHYAETEDYTRMLKLYEKLGRLESKNSQTLINLAKLYAQVGDIDSAIRTANRIIEVDPGLERYAQEFIDSLHNN